MEVQLQAFLISAQDESKCWVQAPTALHPGKGSCYPLSRVLSGPQSRFWSCGEVKGLLLPRGNSSDYTIVHPVAWYYIGLALQGLPPPFLAFVLWTCLNDCKWRFLRPARIVLFGKQKLECLHRDTGLEWGSYALKLAIRELANSLTSYLFRTFGGLNLFLSFHIIQYVA